MCLPEIRIANLQAAPFSFRTDDSCLFKGPNHLVFICRVNFTFSRAVMHFFTHITPFSGISIKIFDLGDFKNGFTPANHFACFV
jgi:hypothetical protein